jgi:hypothetical protein
MASSRRYADVQLCGCKEDIDYLKERQFCATVIKVPGIKTFISFRGTDDNVISWKEDFKMSYMSKIPAQKLACKYLEEALDNLSGSFILTGHSKGGNLAIYSAANTNEAFRGRIEGIYTYDAPGVHTSVLESKGYKAIRSKVVAYVPEDTVVGALLEKDVETVVVKSKLFGVMQHMVYNWQIKGDDLQKLKSRTTGSILFERALKQWMCNYSEEELKIICDVAFDLFADINVVSFMDFKDEFYKKVSDLIKAATAIDEKNSKLVVEALSDLIKIYISLAGENFKGRIPSFSPDKDPIKFITEKIPETIGNLEWVDFIKSKLSFASNTQTDEKKGPVQ